jgi:hypothetical protein
MLYDHKPWAYPHKTFQYEFCSRKTANQSTSASMYNALIRRYLKYEFEPHTQRYLYSFFGLLCQFALFHLFPICPFFSFVGIFVYLNYDVCIVLFNASYFKIVWFGSIKLVFSMPHLIKVPVPSQESERSCICVLGVSMVTCFYDIIRLYLCRIPFVALYFWHYLYCPFLASLGLV